MAKRIPLEVLFGDPERESPRLAPDGSKMAWLAPWQGALNVWAAPVDPVEGVDLEHAEPITDDRDRGIRNLVWSGNNRTVLYFQDVDGDENWHVIGSDVETRSQHDYTPFSGIQAKILAIGSKEPDAVLLRINSTDTSVQGVYRLDLVSAALRRELTNPRLIKMLADTDLVVRGGLRREGDGCLSFWVREDPSAAWRKILIIPPDDAMTTRLIAFTDEGRSILMSSSVGSNYSRLLRVEIMSGAMEVVAEDPSADLKDVRVSRLTHEPMVATFSRERLSYQVLDESVRESFEKVRTLHPGDPVFVDSSNDESEWLVGFVSGAAPVEYFKFSASTGKSQRLFTSIPTLTSYPLSEMEPFSYTARDGMHIEGYLNFPPGADRSNLPTVVAVHGGPWDRESWEYEAVGQWIANRGYLCLKVNFRGSAGYGKNYLNAGNREWGGKMQDDLSDAVAYAVGQGWADARRVGIIGGSYGGYAALAGLAFTPEIYRCGISLYGPSNLVTLLTGMSERWPGAMWEFEQRVGDPVEDKGLLWQRSPLSMADRITAPVLIAHGANDPRVMKDESEEIVRVLQRNHVEHEYIVFDDEGHGFAKQENRFRLFRAAESFLDRHLL